MNILVIDGQGGRIGAQLVREIAAAIPGVSITAVGTNSAATAAMLKAGAHTGATGENAVIVACRKANAIVGPLGIVIADSLLGEISPAMAAAVSSANAVRILLPLNMCDTIVAGVNAPVAELIVDAVRRLAAMAES